MKKITLSLCTAFLSMFVILANPVTALSNVCAEGTGIPPFLSGGVDPNLLLLIDNSGSMYDLAYTEADGQCYDDSYDAASSYSGYFDSDSWYYYDLSNNQFVKTDEVTAWAKCQTAIAGGDEEFSKASLVCVAGPSDGDEGLSGVNVFVATGHFLNWVATSKFDVEKQILTGGKYDVDSGQLILESRGCMDRRFVKEVEMDQQVAVQNVNDMQFVALTLGVRPPMEQIFDIWDAAVAYDEGNIVRYQGVIFEKTAGGDNDTDATFESGDWSEYKQSRWYPGVVYPAGTIVYDTSTFHMYRTEAGGTSLATATILAEDTDVIWIGYNVTQIEIYNMAAGGFDYDACQSALEELGTLTGEDTADEKTRLGVLKSYTEECMGYDQALPNTEEGYVKAAFNHSMQECWYHNKFGIWQPGVGSVSSLKASCEGMYDTIHPKDIDPWDSGYICGGIYGAFPPRGYAGRCWEEAGGALNCTTVACDASTALATQQRCEGGFVEQCDNWNSGINDCKKVDDWYQIEECTGGGDIAVTGWTNDNFYVYDECVYRDCELNDCVVNGSCSTTNGDTCADPDGNECNWWDVTWTRDTTVAGREGWWIHDDVANSVQAEDGYFCVDQALRDFCAVVEVPEVIDPSDATDATGEVWNAPAMLVDSGVTGQLDKPLLVMQGYIDHNTVPTGIIQDVAGSLRMGVMTFNDNGAATECVNNTGGSIAYDCPATGNRDGARIIAYIDQGTEHNAAMVSAVNDIKANSWTPLAEAMYEAIGYFAQKDDADALRLNGDNLDFLIESELGALATWADATAYAAGAVIEDSDGNRFTATTSGTSSGTKPQDDANISWLAVPTPVDPVQAWCQDNHVVVITEGASTADLHADVAAFVAGNTLDDDQAEDAACTDGLYGSTYLDDMTWWGQNAAVADLYEVSQMGPAGEEEDKQSITTHIVANGTLRTVGTLECSPENLMTESATNGGTTLYRSDNPDELRTKLLEVFSSIMSRASAGSAASVISSSRGGEGAVYQAIFWPEKTDATDTYTTAWAGDVHSLFIDTNAIMWEDTPAPGNTAGDGVLGCELDDDNDGVPNVGGDATNNGKVDCDRQVQLVFDETANKTLALVCDDIATSTNCDALKSMDLVNYIWSANKQLAAVADTDIQLNRPVLNDGTWDFTTGKRRYIFTWNDLDNDGIVDTDSDGDLLIDDDGDGVTDSEEVLPLTANLVDNIDWSNPSGIATWWADHANRSEVYHDFNATSSDEVKNIISWLRGTDSHNDEVVDDNGNLRLDTKMRSRQYPSQANAGVITEWRLGDIIHSTPTIVARPAEAYHYIYRDPSYAIFAKKYSNRRHMVYFGANDGMLHAVNGGFYISGKKQFISCREDQRDVDGNCTGTSFPDLGDELWAYVPYNLQPHLKCLTDPVAYEHKYYVDQVPRIFDVQIFEDDCTYNADNTYTCADALHPGGWGTILVGSMRFGGSVVDMTDINGNANDDRRMQSAYFILDITDPERPPQLLGEMTMTTDWSEYTPLGYTTPSPTLVVMRDTQSLNLPPTAGATWAGSTKWYLVMGNGPTTLKGENIATGNGKWLDANAKLAILPLEWLKGAIDSNSRIPVTTDRKPFRIPKKLPGTDAGESGSEGGMFEVTATPGFISDLVSVDYDVEQTHTGQGADYKADAVYFGTVEGAGFTYTATGSYWDGGGKMYRLITKIMEIDINDIDGDSNTTELVEVVSTPSAWNDPWSADANTSPVRTLLDAGRPITAAPSIGYDGENYWIYFGTGRFFDPDDKTDALTQGFYGIKEQWSLYSAGDCTSKYFEWGQVTNTATLDPGAAKGSQGIIRVDQILVAEKQNALDNNPYLYCFDSTDYTKAECFNLLSSVPHFNATYYTFFDLQEFITGESCYETADDTIGIDGWYRQFIDDRERNIGPSTLLGGLVTFTTYKPYSDPCKAEGESFLYGIHFQTGTAWYENVFGTSNNAENSEITVDARKDLGKGLAAMPNIHVGSGADDASAFVQTSTGEIIKIGQENLPIDTFKSGRASWKIEQ